MTNIKCRDFVKFGLHPSRGTWQQTQRCILFCFFVVLEPCYILSQVSWKCRELQLHSITYFVFWFTLLQHEFGYKLKSLKCIIWENRNDCDHMIVLRHAQVANDRDKAKLCCGKVYLHRRIFRRCSIKIFYYRGGIRSCEACYISIDPRL